MDGKVAGCSFEKPSFLKSSIAGKKVSIVRPQIQCADQEKFELKINSLKREIEKKERKLEEAKEKGQTPYESSRIKRKRLEKLPLKHMKRLIKSKEMKFEDLVGESDGKVTKEEMLKMHETIRKSRDSSTHFRLLLVEAIKLMSGEETVLKRKCFENLYPYFDKFSNFMIDKSSNESITIDDEDYLPMLDINTLNDRMLLEIKSKAQELLNEIKEDFYPYDTPPNSPSTSSQSNN